MNGSGKHNNWSLCTDTGINLFAPGKNPKGNMLFLTFLVNVLMMVYKNQNLLRASIMSAGNSHRLGANEAPPAILSIFLGKQLSSILDEIARQISSSKMTSEEKTTLKLGIGRIPEILLDTTDRNRTSPFAFTGNRFEFRAAGSSANCAAAMYAINAAMANQLNEFKVSIDKLMEEGVGKDEAIFRIMKETIIASEPIRFEGDGYSEEWKQEAARRGLTNICHVPEALMHYMDNQSRSVLIGEPYLQRNGACLPLGSRTGEIHHEGANRRPCIGRPRHQSHRTNCRCLSEPFARKSSRTERNIPG